CFLATGDKGGRVVVFELDGHNALESIGSAFAKTRKPLQQPLEFRFQSEFQSHEPEFDYLKSLEIEEKINKIRWCRPSNSSLFLLSTNDKTVKLWKVHEKTVKSVCSFNVSDKNGGRRVFESASKEEHHSDEMMDVEETGKEQDHPQPPVFQRVGIPRLQMPKLKCEGKVVSSACRRVYSNAHAYHINSVAVNSDGETFMSADDLRINLWNLDLSDVSYNIVDIKPTNMEELSEVITAAEFHPHHCNLLMYSSSRGSIRLGDMRANALCDVHAKTFEEPEQPGNKSFFSEIIASLSDIKFTSDGRYIVSRDYLNLKIWDINMESKPVKTIKIHEHLRSKLSDLYENECIFDKFEVVVSGDGNNMATGSYNNNFHIYDRYGKMNLCIEASKMPPRQQQLYQQQGIDIADDVMDTSSSSNASHGGPLNPKRPGSNSDYLDYNRKAMHMSWHPEQPLVAVAGLNNLYIYSQ
ncbi:Serine/threonine protein phosphatase 2A 55 kDa regulatory subunit B beta isoform (AtB beta) (PP2A, partial [Durusdinium trenchii]